MLEHCENTRPNTEKYTGRESYKNYKIGFDIYKKASYSLATRFERVLLLREQRKLHLHLLKTAEPQINYLKKVNKQQHRRYHSHTRMD